MPVTLFFLGSSNKSHLKPSLKMKFIIAAIAFCAVAAYAATDIDSLLERATQLEGTTEKLITEFHNASKSHLLSALEFELAHLQPIVSHMKHILSQVEGSTVRPRQLNFAEEQLVHAVNRVNEELDFVQAVLGHNSTGKTANELANYAQVLIAEAKDALAKHGHEAPNKRDVISLEYYIRQLEFLAKDIVEHPSGQRHENGESELLRIEASLRNLLMRLKYNL